MSKIEPTATATRIAKGALGALFLTTLAGCGGMPGDSVTLENNATFAQNEQSIIDGTLVTNAQNRRNPAVEATVVWGIGCSGLKISERRILTAGHCIDDDVAIGDPISVTNAIGGSPTQTTTVRKIFLHPEFDRRDPTGPSSRDIGILEIEANTPSIPSWNNFTFSRVSKSSTSGALPFRLIAYGCGRAFGQKQQASFASSTPKSGFEPFDRFYIVDDRFPVGLCGGDSGGPLFDGSRNVVGVAVAGFIGAQSFFARLDGLQRFFEAPQTVIRDACVARCQSRTGEDGRDPSIGAGIRSCIAQQCGP